MVHDKKHDLTVLSSKLQDVFTHKNWKTLWQIYTLEQKWPFIVGENVAQKSRPTYLQQHALWVHVESSVLMQHMQTQKISLLEKINSTLPDAEIKDIRWEMKPAKPAGDKKRGIKKNKPQETPEEREAFKKMTSTVEDKKCREALRKLWLIYHS